MTSNHENSLIEKVKASVTRKKLSLGTVGTVIDGVELIIDKLGADYNEDEGEILVIGPVG